MDSTTLQKMIFTPQQLTPEAFEELNSFFDVIEIHPKLCQDFYREMYKFFGTEPTPLQTKMKLYAGNYWDWYVRATWKKFLTLSEDDLVFHLETQLATAFRLGIPVEQKLMHYLFRICVDDDRIKILFEKIQANMQLNPFPISPTSTKPLLFADLVKKVLALPVTDTTSLEFATLYGEVEKQLYGENQTLSEAEKTESTRAFIDLVRFLTEKTSDILSVVDTYVYEFLRDEEEGDIDEDENALPEVPAELGPVEAPLGAPESLVSPLDIESVKKQIDSQFEKDETGQYTDLEGVFAALDQIATESGDESIREFLYFDEESGGFKWKE